MLFSIDSGKSISEIPYRREFERWRKGLSDVEFQVICDELRARIAGSEVQTSSWIPGSDWTGTVYEPIYKNACAMDHRAAAKFFGQIVWKVFMDDAETWAFGHYKLAGIPIAGLTYFRIDRP